MMGEYGAQFEERWFDMKYKFDLLHFLKKMNIFHMKKSILIIVYFE